MAETLLQKAQRLGIKPQNAGQISPASTPPQTESLVQKAQRLGIQPANPPIAEPKQPGFVQGLAQAIAKPFLKTATGIYQGAAGLGNLAQAGVAKLRGDEAGVQKQLADAQRATESGREFDFGYFGKVKGFQPNAPLSTQVKEAAGTGLEMGATLLPVGKAAQIGKLTLGGKVLQGAKLGAKVGTPAGALTGVGQALQEDTGLAETAKQGLIGAGLGLAGGTVLGGAAPLASKAIKGVSGAIKAPEATLRKALPKPENIMNRVARLKPSDAQKFKNLAGESHGSYLQRTGNFGTPEEIVANEATKFTNSLREVDDALAKLPGTHKSPHLTSMLKDLLTREIKVGVPNAESQTIKNLSNKNKGVGLDMSEINQVKRIYERTVKLGYQKEQNAIGIERSTRLDDALRKWQVETANKLELKNLPELNKQTQLSKFLINKLGGQLAGRTGNEAISLTDWIILSGGDPTAISAFFAKRLLLNKGVQAGVAKMLSGKPVGAIKAKFGTNSQTNRIATLPPKLLPNKLGKSFDKSVPQVSKSIKTPPSESLGAIGGVETDEQGNLKFNPEKAALSVGAIAAIKRGKLPAKPQSLAPIYKGETDLTLKTLEKLKGKSVTSKQEIMDLSNAQDLKQAERDAIRRALADYPDVSKDPLAAEARKYKSAEDIAIQRKTNLRMAREDFPTLSSHPAGTNLPDNVTVYRGVPSNAHPISAGDFVSLDKADALRYGKEVQIVKVPKNELRVNPYTPGIDLVYDPKPILNKTGKLELLNKIAFEDASDNLTTKVIANKLGVSTKDAYKVMVDYEKKGLVYKVGYRTKDGWEDPAFSSLHTNSLSWGPTENGIKQLQESKSQLTSIYNQAVKGDKVNVKEFANKVKTDLLPLETSKPGAFAPKYENISLPDELRGPVANYREKIYRSPIKTSAGEVHFGRLGGEGYFAHTRIEDLPPKDISKAVKPGGPIKATQKRIADAGDTRRVIELQSDLFQKGRSQDELQNVKFSIEGITKNEGAAYKRIYGEKAYKKELGSYQKQEQELSKLEPYRNTWHERVIREEIKQAAKDGKTKLQFPTGETAMKIEGLGESHSWSYYNEKGQRYGLELSDLEIGKEIAISDRTPEGAKWIITDVLGDGKFNAIPKEKLDTAMTRGKMFKFEGNESKEAIMKRLEQNYGESFDISGKVDTNNPIYKFYEKEVQKYLNKFGGKKITDAQGVSWIEVPIKKEMGRMPIEAFGVLPLAIPQKREEQRLPPKPPKLNGR